MYLSAMMGLLVKEMGEGRRVLLQGHLGSSTE
jgi:hypothetical protein